MSWQTMETAPKNMTKVLGWDGYEVEIIWYVPAHHSLDWRDDDRGTWVRVGESTNDGDWMPSHWQLLPAPPVYSSNPIEKPDNS